MELGKNVVKHKLREKKRIMENQFGFILNLKSLFNLILDVLTKNIQRNIPNCMSKIDHKFSKRQEENDLEVKMEEDISQVSKFKYLSSLDMYKEWKKISHKFLSKNGVTTFEEKMTKNQSRYFRHKQRKSKRTNERVDCMISNSTKYGKGDQKEH
ncbi:hypothetical protein CR513_18783, partial [Mucuna pruriens]